MVKESGVCNNL